MSKGFIRIVFLSLVFLIVSCGGGGGGSTTPATNLSGTVAIGQALAGATITVVDINGKTATGTANASGGYTIDVSGLNTASLLMIKAVGSISSTSYTVYSAVSNVPTGTNTANVTNLTTAIVEIAGNGSSAATMFASPSSYANANLVGANATLIALLSLPSGVTNLISNSFTASTSATPSAGMDTLLSQFTNTPTAVAGTSNTTGTVILSPTGGGSLVTATTLIPVASTTLTAIQNAKAAITALNNDAGLVTGANMPPAILSGFTSQFTQISRTIANSLGLASYYCSVNQRCPIFDSNGNNVGEVVTSVSSSTGTLTNGTDTWTVVVTPTGGSSYTSSWVGTASTTGTVTTTSLQVSGQLMPVSSGAAATVISGGISLVSDSSTGISTATITNLSLSTTNNGATTPKPESLVLSNVTIVDNPTATHPVTVNGGLTATIGTNSYNLTVVLTSTGNPITSANTTVTYSGPNGAFTISDVSTLATGNMETDIWSISQGSTNIGATLGPYLKTGPVQSLPTTLNVYNGSTQIGTLSGRTISFIDGETINFSY